MSTEIPADLHPLVAKAAREWLALATRYGVGATVRSMTSLNDGGYTTAHPDGAIVDFDTRSHMERGSVMIYPPAKKGSTVRQSPLIMRHYRGVGGKARYGQKPGTRLRDLADRITSYWSPTWSDRLKAEVDRAAVRATQAQRAVTA